LAFEGNPAAFRNTATNPFLGQFRRQDYGLAPNNETHHLTAAATLALPWKINISPIFQVGSGRPVDIFSSSDKWGVGSGRGNAHAIIPAGGKKNDFASLTALFNSDGSVYSGGFYKSCLTDGSCQEVSYDSTGGQTFVELDARISKTLTFGEKYNVDLFFQSFDLTNRANFGPFLQGNVNSIDPTDPSSFLKPLSFITPNSTVIPGSFTGEFGARFSF
jgi:hypothetical protein